MGGGAGFHQHHPHHHHLNSNASASPPQSQDTPKEGDIIGDGGRRLLRSMYDTGAGAMKLTTRLSGNVARGAGAIAKQGE